MISAEMIDHFVNRHGLTRDEAARLLGSDFGEYLTEISGRPGKTFAGCVAWVEHNFPKWVSKRVGMVRATPEATP